MPPEPNPAVAPPQPAPEPRKRKRHPGHESSVRNAVDALVKGIPAEEICRAIVAKWEVSEKAARNWVNEAKSVLRGESPEVRREIDLVFARAVRRRDRLYFQAWSNGDYRLCLAIEQETCKLLGLYPAERQQVEHVNRSEKSLDEMTDAELIAIIRAAEKGEADSGEPGDSPPPDAPSSPAIPEAAPVEPSGEPASGSVSEAAPIEAPPSTPPAREGEPPPSLAA